MRPTRAGTSRHDQVARVSVFLSLVQTRDHASMPVCGLSGCPRAKCAPHRVVQGGAFTCALGRWARKQRPAPPAVLPADQGEAHALGNQGASESHEGAPPDPTRPLVPQVPSTWGTPFLTLLVPARMPRPWGGGRQLGASLSCGVSGEECNSGAGYLEHAMPTSVPRGWVAFCGGAAEVQK